MKTILLYVFSIFLISCSQTDSYGQPNSTDWPKISDLQVEFSGAVVLINWVADVEPKDVYYEVERSNDGVHFKTVALMLSGLVNKQNYTYRFKEKKKETLKVVYRIKQLKQDGSFRIVGERSL